MSPNASIVKHHNPGHHLDLGCGDRPHNPYRRARLSGVDLRASELEGIEIRVANLALEPIPFPDNHFDSVSAFDVLEHIPRVLPSADGRSTYFPFIRLMNEVARVLKPDGRFWALTPAYPGAAAFQDPTHCNFITERTHWYFSGTQPLGRMYGFHADFRVLRAEWVIDRDAQWAEPMSFEQKFRRWRRHLKGQLSYYLWELQVVKPATTASLASPAPGADPNHGG